MGPTSLRSTVLAAAFVAALASPADAQLAVFQGLGFLDGEQDSTAVDLSGDGSTVIGTSGSKGFRWRAGSLIQVPNHPAAVDGHGDAIVGTDGGPGLDGGWRWIRGYAHLLRIPGPPPNPIEGPLIEYRAQAISDDGRFVWGVTLTDMSAHSFPYNPWIKAYRVQIGLTDWVDQAVDDGCDSDYNVPNQPEITAVSPDGSFLSMVEQCAKLGNPPSDEPRVWKYDGMSATVGIVDAFIPILPRAVSADGARVVGYDDPQRAAYATVGAPWPASSYELPPIPGTSPLSSIANDVSASGAIIVGRASLPEGDVAFWWAQGAGTRRLQDMVAAPPGWTLTEAVAISRDGRVIAGNGIDPDGHPQAWIAALPAAVPALRAPLVWAGTVLLATGGGLAAHRRARVPRSEAA